MKKILSIAIITICMFGFGVNVFAASTCIEDSQASNSSFASTYNDLKSNYENGGKKETISGSGLIDIFGRTDSSGNKTYAGGKIDVNSIISNLVTCSGGEKYIKISIVGIASKGCSNSSYWSDQYSVTCTNNSTSTDNSTVIDKSTGNVVSGGNNSSGSGSSSTGSGSSTTGSGSGTNSGSGTGSSSSSGSGYNSSSTVNNESTGINTYFVVLGLVGVISYIFMMCVKKYNLFKNI